MDGGKIDCALCPLIERVNSPLGPRQRADGIHVAFLLGIQLGKSSGASLDLCADCARSLERKTPILNRLGEEP